MVSMNTLDLSFIVVMLQAFQQNFNGQILSTNGKEIAQNMKAEMEGIFNENIEALKVRGFIVFIYPNVL